MKSSRSVRNRQTSPSAIRGAGKPKSSAAPSARQALLLDQQLCFALYSASLAMTRVYKPLLDQLGLTYPQYLVMLALWEADAQTVGSLGERLHLDSGTLTPLLKRMEANGLLQRQRSAADERRVDVHLTESGRKLKPRAHGIPWSVASASGCELSELRALTLELQQLRQSLLESVSTQAANTAT